MATSNVESEEWWHRPAFLYKEDTKQAEKSTVQSGEKVTDRVQEVIEQLGIKRLNYRQRYRRIRRGAHQHRQWTEADYHL